MNEILGVDVDLDWLEGLDEPGELIWTEDGWSLADVTVAVQPMALSAAWPASFTTIFGERRRYDDRSIGAV